MWIDMNMKATKLGRFRMKNRVFDGKVTEKMKLFEGKMGKGKGKQKK